MDDSILDKVLSSIESIEVRQGAFIIKYTDGYCVEDQVPEHVWVHLFDAIVDIYLSNDDVADIPKQIINDKLTKVHKALVAEVEDN